MNRVYKNKKALVFLSLAFLVLMAVIIIVGSSYYARLRRATEMEKINNLSAVADLKVRQIVQWRENLLGDSRVLMESVFFVEGVSRFLTDPNNQTSRQKMLARLKAQMQSYNYHNIMLLNSSGRTMLLANPNMDSPNDISKGFLAKARDGGQPIMSDLFICRKESIPHLEITTPLFERRNGKKHLLGYVNLQMDPRVFLYPTIQGWPTASKSAEILLVRRERDDVLFLNELRFKKETALNFKIPVTKATLPAAMGVLGKEGPVVGYDYRGVKVLAVLRSIPGTGWHMVAKIDYEEVFADLLRQEKLILAIILTLIFLTAAVVLTIFLYQRRDFYRSLYIKESERKALQTHYDYLVKYANDIILLMDDQYRIVEANQRAAETYGYTEGELLGMSVNQLRSDPSQPFFKVIDSGIASDGHLFETVHRRSDGKTFPVEISARSITIDNKRFIQAIIRNISERKQYELDIRERNKELEAANQELAESETRYRTFMSSATDIAFLKDEQLRYLMVNKAQEEFFGQPSDKILGKTDYDLMPQEAAQACHLSDQMVLENHRTTINQEQVGDKIYEVRKFPVNLKSGKIGVGAYIRDITERKKAEEDLRKSETQMRILINTLPEYIWLKNTEGIYLSCNPKFEQFFGAKISEVIGKTDYDFVDKKTADFFREKDQEAINAGKPCINEEEVTLAVGGQKIILETTKTPMYDAQGKIIGVLGIGHDITERKRTEQQIIHNQKRMESLVNILQADVGKIQQFLDYALDEAIKLTNSKLGYIYYYNEETKEFTLNSWSKDVMQQCTVANPQSLYHLEKTGLWGETVRQRKPILVNDFQAPHPLKKGLPEGHAPLRNFLTVPIFSGGKIVAVVGVANKEADYDQSDILQLTILMDSVWKVTDRKRAEEELKERESRLQKIFEILPIGLWFADKNGKLITGNPAGVKIWGAEPHVPIEEYGVFKARRLPSGQEIAPDDWALAHTIKEGVTITDELLEIDAFDGQKKTILNYTSPVLDEKGQVQGAIVVNNDITELKLAERSLHASQEKYRNLVENINDVIFSTNLNGAITYISPVMQRTFGYQPDEIIGKHFVEYIHPEDVNLLQTDFERALQGEIRPSEYRVRIRDGSYKYVLSTSRIVTEGGQVIGLTGTITDISDQKRMEQEKKQIESQLFQAHKMEAIGQLAGGVAHDFNNMLAGIMGNAEILAMKLSNEPALLGLVERIISSSEHAAILTKQLLSFSRKGKYQMIPVNIHKIIGEVVSILSNTVDRKIRIKQFLKAGQYTILGDPTQLQNAFLNLGLNARDAMPQGGELIFSTELAELDKNYLNAHHYKLEPGRYLQISVTDTGTGIDQNTKEHLFEPFFTTKEPGKGTGLGLASVYGIVKNHSGSIEVYSELGHGTTMKIYLPVTEAEVEEIGPATEYQDNTGTERILLVDDEEMIRVMASQILAGLGYKVKTCQDGQEAVEYYRENHQQIDLVILDMIMPQLNGREAFAEMKKINPDIKALLSSGFSADGEAQEILKEGVKDFVQKPFRIAELMSKVRKALGGK